MRKKYYPHIDNKKKLFLKIFTFFIIIFSLQNKIIAQQFDNWLFPNFNGLTFRTDPPIFLGGSQFNGITTTTAVISDRNSNLLFSSDGINVWDKNGNQMPNGFGLLGSDAQINTALIVPFVNDTSKYYLFVAKGLGNT